MTLTESRPGAEPRLPRLHVEDADRTAAAAGMDPAMASIHMFQMLLHSPSAFATMARAAP